MRHLLCLGLITVVCGAAFAADAPEDAKRIQGVWKPETAEMAGRPLPEAFVKSLTLTLKEGRYDVVAGDKTDQGTYTLDAAAKPKGMTVTSTAGPNKGTTFPAIYEWDGDALRICYDLSGKKAPTEFKSAAGTNHYLVTYRRQKE